MTRITLLLLASVGFLAACQPGGSPNVGAEPGSLANPTDGFQSGQPDV